MPERLGTHVIQELYGCRPELLNDVDGLGRLVLAAVSESGATILHSHFRRFEPQGCSGIVMIAESHLALHTWPEHGYCAVDYFTCGDRVRPAITMDILERELAPDRAGRTWLMRGMETRR